MTRDSTLRKLRALKPWLTRKSVTRLAVFGSMARGEAKPTSDIDLLVEFSVTPGLLDFVALQRELSEKLGRKVDLATPNALHPALKESILAEAINV